MDTLPFRIGTTSYIIPDDIVPNVRFLADKVQDIELVLFEVDDGPNNLPDEAAMQELERLARQHDLTYTVHLPLDLRLAADGDEGHVSMLKAHKVIKHTQRLNPWAYVMHLDGREVRENPTPEAYQIWMNQSTQAMERVAEWAGGPDRMAVENLETYPLAFWDDIFSRTPAWRCVDIGHLWLDGHDALPFVQRALPRTRVIHIHGIGERAHQSLGHQDPEDVKAVLGCLRDQNYTGVVTMEVFGEEDFNGSMEAIRKAWEAL